MSEYKTVNVNFVDTFVKLYRNEIRENDTLPVKSITFVVTEGCSLNCSYCYECNKNTNNKMTKETGKKAVDMLFKLYGEQNHYINSKNAMAISLEFIGGEPLLEIDVIDYVTEYFKEKAIKENHPWKLRYVLNISTNGTEYLNPKVQNYIHKNKGRINVGITIDGNKELHDSCRRFPDGRPSYDIVEKSVKHWNSIVSGDKSTKLTLCPENIAYLGEAAKNMYDNLEMTSVYANCVFEQGWNIDHAKIFYTELKRLADYLLYENRYKEKAISLFDETIGNPLPEHNNENWCGGNGKMMAISTTGEIYPCLRFVPFSLKTGCKPIPIGDVESGIYKKKEHIENINMLESITRRSQSTAECFTCPIASGCAWCTAYNYQETGTPNKRVTYICIMHKARVLANAYYWNRLYREINSTDRFEMHIPKEWATEIISEDEYNMLLELSI